MEQATAECSEPKTLFVENLSFEQIPDQSRLFLDYLKNAPELSAYYPEKIVSHVDIARRFSIVLENYTTNRHQLADALLEINKRWGASAQTQANIELLREKETVAIVTSQPSGLFGGSLSTIYKALSIIKTTACLKARGIKTVPVFWIDSENEDFNFTTKTFAFGRDGKSSEIQIDLNSSIGNAILDETIEKVLKDFFQKLLKNDFSFDWQNLVREAYQPDFTLNEAFARLLTKLFGDFGLVLIDPLDENLKQLTAPIYFEIVQKSIEINRALTDRKRKLIEAGYRVELSEDENSFPFSWINDDGKLIALERRENIVKNKDGQESLEFDVNELAELARLDPRRLIPNAAICTAVADFLLPTIARYGDSAEIACFAQTSEIYRILERPVTPILPRASITIIDAKTSRTFDKYDLALTDFFEKSEVLRNRVYRQFLDSNAGQIFADVEKNINVELNGLDRNLASINAALSDNLARRRQKILWHVNILKNKFERAENNKKEVIRRRLDAALAIVYPNGGLQENSLNVVSMLVRYGDNLIEWLLNSIDIDAQNHQIIEL